MSNGFLGATGSMMKGLVDAAAKKRDELVSSAELKLKMERLKAELRDLRQEKDELLNGLALKVYEMYVKGQIQDPDLKASCQAVQHKQWEVDEKWAEINYVKSGKA
ncbi:MAG: hypothetical protein ACI376_02455 [Candidatus Bruticola sp.]